MPPAISNKKWMTIVERLSSEYLDGVASFILFAKENVEDVNWCCCPCVNCRNFQKHNLETIMEHLICDGIDRSYTTWTYHGESPSTNRVNVGVSSSSTSNQNNDMFPKMKEMLNNTFGRVHLEDLPEDEDDDQDECDDQDPHDQDEGDDWKTFIKMCSTEEDKAHRDKGKTCRKMMMNPHTTGRRGSAKMAEEMKKQSSTGTVTRTQIFSASHTKKDGTSLGTQIDEIRRLALSDPFFREKDLDNDPVATVCGRDGRGNIRGMGTGVSKTSIQASAQAREIAQQEKRAREWIQSQVDMLRHELDEERRARKILEEKVNLLSPLAPSKGTSISTSVDQFDSSQGTRPSSIQPEIPVNQPSMRCLLKNLKNKVIALGRMHREATTSRDSYAIVIDNIFEVNAELYASERTFGNVTIGDIITWPKGLVDFI